MPESIVIPPYDKSGGIMVLSYTNGIDTHKASLHLKPLAVDDNTTYDTATNGGSSDNGYSSESTVQDTFDAYKSHWKVFYTDNWTLRMTAFYRNVTFGTPGHATMVEQFPLPVSSVETGVAAGSDPDGITRCGMFVFSSRSLSGGRARFVLVGSSLWDSAIPQVIVGSTSGSGSQVQQFVGYMTSKATAICCHDGAQAIGPMHWTFPYNRRLRRNYRFA